jgi:hypothetical protein
MAEHGTLRNCDEAMRFLDQIADPITRSFVNMAFVHMVKKGVRSLQCLHYATSFVTGGRK